MLTPMAKITPLRVTEEFEHFVRDLRESFWGDVYGQTRLAWKRFWEAESMRERDSHMKTGWYDRADPGERADYRNGFYQRDFVTRLGTIRLRVARTRGRNFSPRAGEVSASSRGRGDPDSGGFLARDLDAPGGAESGGCPRGDLSTNSASALLGAQDAEHPRESAQTRLRANSHGTKLRIRF